MSVSNSFDPIVGHPWQAAPLVRSILCGNPSGMTYKGTNTYLIGDCDIAVIDPGPNDPKHLGAILNAIGPDEKITHIIVTHSHLDHSPLAKPLAKRTGAPIYGFGSSSAGRRPIMQHLADTGLVGGGEGVDHEFTPNIPVTTGDVIAGNNWSLEVLHTPGHFSNHIALRFGDIWFTGDHVMGWASSLVSPPDGDLNAFMASCRTLLDRPAALYLSGHGGPIPNPHDRLKWLIDHRQQREAQIVKCLNEGRSSIRGVTRAVYRDVGTNLISLAERNILAHLVDLYERNLVGATEPLSNSSRFFLK